MRPLPTTDARRAAQLRAELDRSGSAMTPGWAVGVAPGSFGRALLEIAALLAEESTTRLDRTAARDALAFFDTLDVPPPAPQAATATLVFVAEESRTTMTPAPVGVQVGADVDGDEVIFETARALDVSPARIAELVAVDPDADHVERAPGRVRSTEPPDDPVAGRVVVTAASAGSTTLQVAPAIGLVAGDQLRILDVAYRVQAVKQDLVTLEDPLEAPVPAGTSLVKIEALESFTLRNLQAHACYVGHESLLNLEQPATIDLVVRPSGLAARLAALGLRFSLWATLDGEDAAAWQDLDLTGAFGDTLRLRKRWTGSVDTTEVDGRKNRWLRVTHPDPISATSVAPRVDAIALEVRSEPPPTTGPQIGSRTVANAFHNASPLAVSGRFLPFGPTPNRFDIFSFAAPEALSKHGATVDVDIRLADASLLSLVAPINAEPGATGTLAYGIGANGLLHAVTVPPVGSLSWRVLVNPTDDGTTVVLDGAPGLLALRVAVPFGVADVVVCRDRNGRLWSGWFLVGSPLFSSWQPIPDDGDVAIAELVLVPSAGSGFQTLARLLHVAEGRLRTIDLRGSGQDQVSWSTITDLGAGPPLGGAVAMGPVQRAATSGGSSPIDTDVVLAADDGSVWFGLIGRTAAGLDVTWRSLAPAGSGARVDVRPAATHAADGAGVRLWVAWADGASGVAGWLGATDGTGGDVRDAATGAFDAAPGSALRVAAQTWTASATQPLTTAVASAGGDRSILVWFDEGSAEVVDVPRDPSPAPPTDLLIVRPDPLQADPPLVVLPGTGETLVTAALDQQPSASLDFDLHDGVAVPGVHDASHHLQLLGGPAPRVELLGPARIVQGDDRVYEVDNGFGTAQSYRVLQHLDAGLQAVELEVRAGGVVRLDPTDALTDAGDRLVVGDEAPLVLGVDDTTEPGARLAALDVALAGRAVGDLVSYTPVRVVATGNVGAGDRQTLLGLTQQAQPGQTVRFDDAQPRIRVVRSDALATGGHWWRVGSGWTVVPVATTATVLGDATVGAWSVRALDRGFDNPELSWEFFDGDGWRRLETGFVDGTNELASSGTVSFRVPATLSATEIGGRTDLWIRARLVGGDYGRPKFVVTTAPGPSGTTVQSTTIDTSDLHPPEILSIEASFELDAEVAPEAVLVVDNLATLDQTQASAVDQARFPLFSGARAIDPDVDGRAVYVGLTRAPGVRTLALAVVADDQDAPGPLIAEILTAAGWRRATVDDGTDGLHRTGLVQVFLHDALVRASLFGTEGFWLRLRPPAGSVEGAAAWTPVVRSLLPNGVPAVQARTVVQEILGSSLGEPSIGLDLAETPVLPDTVELRVREQLSEDERSALEAERRQEIRSSGRAESEVAPVVRTIEGVDGTWVRWRRVDSFVDADGDARVFRLEPSSGRVTFGDGRRGKIPPAGRDAIRAFRYQQGGGRKGNVRAWTELALKSALEGIEAVVLPADAAGGVDTPDPSTLLERAPDRIRHAGRAVTAADLEAIAVDAAPEIVRARCLTPARAGDPVRVVVAAKDGTRRPVPSLALRSTVAGSLRAAGWGGLSARGLRVEAPTYVDVAVTVRLRAPAASAAQVEQAAAIALLDLFHPTDGGPDGGGWPFGRRPWASDVLRALRAVDGIDRVDGVDLRRRLDGAPVEAMPAEGLVAAAEADVDVQIEPVVDP